MKSKYILTIPERCNENWAEMPLSGKGRDCSKCEKSIRDFSKLSDAELISLLKSEERICGRFDPTQLDRPLLNDRKKLMPTFNLYAVAAGIGVLVSFPSFGASVSYHTPNVNLIELLQGDENLPFDDAPLADDSLITVVVKAAHYNVPMQEMSVQLIDLRGAIVDEVTTDKNGSISYSKMMLEELQVQELLIPTTNQFKEMRLPWSATSPSVTEVHVKSNKDENLRMMGIVIRPQF